MLTACYFVEVWNSNNASCYGASTVCVKLYLRQLFITIVRQALTPQNLKYLRSQSPDGRRSLRGKMKLFALWR